VRHDRFPHPYPAFRGWGGKVALRQVAAVLLGLALVLTPAQAENLRVGDLVFDYASPWRRAEAAEEKGAEGLILRRQEGKQSLVVLLPQHQALLKLPAEDFFAQLQIRWQVLYGKAVKIDWVEAGGRRWLAARRPSMERSNAVVFHLVTVLNGMAHHLLVYAPVGSTALPEAVSELLADHVEVATPTSTAEVPATETTATETTATEAPTTPPADAGQPGAVSGSEPVAPPSDKSEKVVVAPIPATPVLAPPLPVAEGQPPIPKQPPPPAQPVEPAERWVLKRVVRVLPQGRDLDVLARLEANPPTGRHGLITGYALERREHGVKGFLEGYNWVTGPDGKDVRWPFLRHWEVQWQPPAEIWTGGETLPLEVTIGPGGIESDQARLGVRAELALLCGSRRGMIAAYNRMDRGEPATLAPFSDACLGERGGLPFGEAFVTAVDRTAEQAAPLKRRLSLDLPRRIELAPPPGRGSVRRLLLTVRPLGSETGQAPGDRLLSSVAMHYIYVPEAAPATRKKR